MYDQQAALGGLLPALEQAYRDFVPRHTFEVVLVDDASNDRTFDIAWPWSERAAFPVKVIRLKPHEGVGGAIRQGLDFCIGTAVVTWNAELVRPLEDAVVLAAALEDGADVVTVPQASTNRGERLITRNVTGVSNIHRAYRREALMRIMGRRDDALIHAELLANALAAGLRVREATELAPEVATDDARPSWFTALRLRRGTAS